MMMRRQLSVSSEFTFETVALQRPPARSHGASQALMSGAR